MLKYVHRPGGTGHCPECRESISKQANICPHCRTDLKAHPSWQPTPKQAGGCSILILLSLVSSGSFGAAVYFLSH